MAKKTDTDGLVIGMDGKRAVMNNTGLGNYSRYAVNILSAAFPSTRFRLYSPADRDNDRLRPLLGRGNVELFTPNLRFDNGLSRAFWRSIDMPLQLRNDNIALYHGLSNELPLTIKGVCPTVVTIHDLIWRRVPGDYAAIDRRLYDLKYGRSARIATRVVAISECTKRDMIADWGISEDKIDVIYQGIDPIFTLPVGTTDRARVRETYKLPERYIISVGTVQSRKNQMLAVRGLKGLPESVELVIVGRMAGEYGDSVRREIERLGLSDRVRLLEGVPFTDIPALYSAADLSTYTSRYEGFGLPMAESIASGTPVIACTGSCLEEAGGPGAVYIDPDDVDAWRLSAERFLDDVVFHDRTVRLGKQHIRKFSAENFAKQTMGCYKKALISELLVK
ncbi:MAG: glycosyltransferase family 4 protein [Bacteroidales bacterium]|nr:glycosyltransferase family 4 protein [Bacteroidales bacterium]